MLKLENNPGTDAGELVLFRPHLIYVLSDFGDLPEVGKLDSDLNSSDVAK